MEKHLEKIIKTHKNLLGNNINIEKINVGFTNTIYKVNDSYIIKFVQIIVMKKDLKMK